MRKLTFAVAALLICAVSNAQAVTMSVVGGVLDAPIGTTGQLEIHVDTSPEDTVFNNGGIELKLGSSNPGVLRFDAAAVANPSIFFGSQDRWTTALVQGLADDDITLLRGASVGSPGLTSADPANEISPGLFLFATIDYTVTGAGLTDITLMGADGVNDFISEGAEVNPELVGTQVSGLVPEPSTMALAGLSLIGLVLRRRNG